MSAEARFWAKVQKGKPNECWPWTAATNSGYGYMSIDNKLVRAPRFSYELVNDKIPTGLVLDHLCRNRRCVNPAHLEVVTHRTNILRGIGVAAHAARLRKCQHGHAFSPENTRTVKRSDGRTYRLCRQCKRERDRAA